MLPTRNKSAPLATGTVLLLVLVVVPVDVAGTISKLQLHVTSATIADDDDNDDNDDDDKCWENP